MNNTKSDRSGRWAIFIATLSLVVSGLTFYFNYLEPFELEIMTDAIVQMQYNVNTKNPGFYINTTFQNTSPQFGAIQSACATIKRSDSDEEYILPLVGIRQAEVDSSGQWGLWTETPMWPLSSTSPNLSFYPYQRITRTYVFSYAREDPFPLSTGVYEIKLLFWTSSNELADYTSSLKLDITSDVIAGYTDNRERQSSQLFTLVQAGVKDIRAGKMDHPLY